LREGQEGRKESRKKERRKERKKERKSIIGNNAFTTD
jgi:hypothetical protein